MMNPNWNRWLKASIAKHFDLRRQNLPMFIEGINRPEVPPDQFFELRIDGPSYRLLNKDEWTATLQINAIITNSLTLDAYLLERNLGTIVAIYEPNIFIYKYGDEPGVDDQSLIGCLTVQGEILTHNFGRVQEDNTVYQGMIDGVYSTVLRGN